MTICPSCGMTVDLTGQAHICPTIRDLLQMIHNRDKRMDELEELIKKGLSMLNLKLEKKDAPRTM